jgi:hypothetical protein
MAKLRYLIEIKQNFLFVNPTENSTISAGAAHGNSVVLCGQARGAGGMFVGGNKAQRQNRRERFWTHEVRP